MYVCIVYTVYIKRILRRRIKGENGAILFIKHCEVSTVLCYLFTVKTGVKCITKSMKCIPYTLHTHSIQ